MRLLALALIGAVGCGETVNVPFEIGTDDPSCGEDFRGECAASAEVELARPDKQTERQCIELPEGVATIEAFPAALANVSFPSLEEGDEVTITISIFELGACEGEAFVTGTSEQAALDSSLSSIVVDLVCTETVSCEGGGTDFAAIVHEIFGDDEGGSGLAVSVGYSTTSYVVDSQLTNVGNGRFIGQRSAGTGCLSVGIDETFGALPYVSCELATGQDGADHFAFAASTPALVSAFTEAGLAVGRTILGRVETEAGNPVGGVGVSAEGEGINVFYFNNETGDFFVRWLDVWQRHLRRLSERGRMLPNGLCRQRGQQRRCSCSQRRGRGGPPRRRQPLDLRPSNAARCRRG